MDTLKLSGKMRVVDISKVERATKFEFEFSVSADAFCLRLRDMELDFEQIDERTVQLLSPLDNDVEIAVAECGGWEAE